MPMPMPITHPRRLATTVAALTVLVAALLPVSSPAAADGTLGTRHQHDLANRASWEYDGTASSSTASTRSHWGDHPLRVQAHGSATDGLVDVVVVAHPADRVSPVRVTGLVVDVVVTDPEGTERVATMTAASAVIDAAGLTLTSTLPAGGPGEYGLTGTVAYTVVPAPDPEPADGVPTPPAPPSPPVAQQAAATGTAQAARPVAAPPAYTG